jgi:hypothetical protein
LENFAAQTSNPWKRGTLIFVPGALRRERAHAILRLNARMLAARRGAAAVVCLGGKFQ